MSGKGKEVRLAPGAGVQLGVGGPGGYVKAGGNPLPYILPWACGLLLLLVAVGIRFGLARDEYAWYWSPFTLLVYTCLTAGAHYTTRTQGAVHRVLAIGGFALAGAWTWWIAGVPHVTWRPFVVYVGLMAIVCSVSCMYSMWKEGQPGGGRTMHDHVASAIRRLRAVNEVGIVNGGVEASYQMVEGVPASELADASALDSLASLHGVRPGAIRAMPSTTDASRGKLRIDVTDPYASPPPWPGPSIREGGSMADPLVFGSRRAEAKLQIWLPGDEATNRNASMVQVTGMPGAGKSVLLRKFMIEILSRDDGEYYYGNPRKLSQEPQWVRDGASRVAGGGGDRQAKLDVVALLKYVRDVEGPRRDAHLGAAGLGQWEKGCGLSYLVVIVDEIAGIASDVEDLLVDLAETVRSLGICLVVGLQRATGDRWPTSIRACFGTQICLGVKRDEDAEAALPEWVLDAGAMPWLWEARKPGMCYAVAPGVEDDDACSEARVYAPTKEREQQWAEHFIARRAGRSTVAPGAEVAVHPAGEALDGEVVDPDEDLDDDDDGGELDDELDREPWDDDDADEGEEVDMEETQDEVEGLLEEAAENLDDEDLDDEELSTMRIRVPGDCHEVLLPVPMPAADPDGGGMSMRLTPRMPQDEARTYARTYLRRVAAEAGGQIEFKKEELAGEILGDVGYKSSWFDKVLGEFLAEQPAWIVRKEGRRNRGWYVVTVALALVRGGDAT